MAVSFSPLMFIIFAVAVYYLYQAVSDSVKMVEIAKLENANEKQVADYIAAQLAFPVEMSVSVFMFVILGFFIVRRA